MELHTDVTSADIVLARVAMALRPSFVFWFNWAIALAMPAILSPELLKAGGFALFVFALLVLLVFCFMTLIGLVVGAIEVVMAKKSARGVLGHHVLRLTEEGLVEETEFNRTIHPWHSVDRIVRFAGLTLVRAGAGWHVIPKRALRSQDGEAFMRALREHVPLAAR